MSATETEAPYYRDCDRCGDDIIHGSYMMCSECIRETPGTEECSICTEHGEEICGYHATCLWYCPGCGCIRQVGNKPARPESEITVGCYNHATFDGESHRMVRLTYTSTVEKRLRDYMSGST